MGELITGMISIAIMACLAQCVGLWLAFRRQGRIDPHIRQLVALWLTNWAKIISLLCLVGIVSRALILFLQRS